ncbi:MAG TPA: AAA family ATPase [Dehalococcoidia bacterium]|nr:AAA family ATPase [Dehalococcoidia bacterium]
MTPGLIVLFGGPAGAGKTTLAAAWCATRERAVHLQLDDIRSFIVSGLADPQGGGPEVGQQYALAVTACCSLARVFATGGYDVAVDDVLEPPAFEACWRPELEDLNPEVLIVLPSIQETLRRSVSRQKRVKQELTKLQHAASQVWPAALCLDTTGLSVAESLALARSRGLLP